jgi:AraC-like DNA-binding protein
MRQIKILMLFVMLFIFQLISAANITDTYFYRRWMNLSSEKLMEKGSKYAEFENKPDSALVCFSIVANRYSSDLSRDEQKYIIGSYNGKWFVYFFFYFDYAKSYESLSKALKFCDEFKLNKARVFLNFGCMFQTMSEQSKDLKLDQKAFEYYKKSFYEARKYKATEVMFNAFGNLVYVAASLNKLDEINKEWTIINEYKYPTGNNLYDYVFMQYHGMMCMKNHEYDKALDIFIKQLSEMPENDINIRYRYLTIFNISDIYSLKGDYQKAVFFMKEAERIANKYEMKDAKIDTYYKLAECYKHLKMEDLTEDYRNKYFRIKDTLLNYHQLASVSEMQFLDKMKSIDDEMTDMKHRAAIKNILLAISFLLAIVFTTFIIMMYKKNKRLSRTNESLYKKNVEMLEAEEKERQARQEKDKLMAEMKPEKYKNSSLKTDSKQELIDKIVDVLENNEEIFSLNFSIERLAELVDSKYKYVSQVINETYGCNFNIFLNEYRIKEACKRMNDFEHYGNFTIEAIADGVGFKSPNTFRSSFRRVTGLSPSEYQKIARHKNKASS